ncbi:alpha-mannosidase I MNS4-like [Arachis hypogaea]|uniref:alpha-mannosidase I MNS4-like n=1 Tax=Arachis hypogaea TaxID=3818 RepID=UPI003B214282
MFYHAFNGYIDNAFPLDKMRPMSCTGKDTLGGYTLTLIDSLELWLYSVIVTTLPLSLNELLQNKTISLFEMTIRVLGGLLLAHLIANDYATGCDDWCRSKLRSRILKFQWS